LMANMALEIGGGTAEFGELIRRYFKDWTEAVTAILNDRYTEADATLIAAKSLARIQGALVLRQIDHEHAHFNGAVAELGELLAA